MQRTHDRSPTRCCTAPGRAGAAAFAGRAPAAVGRPPVGHRDRLSTRRAGARALPRGHRLHALPPLRAEPVARVGRRGGRVDARRIACGGAHVGDGDGLAAVDAIARHPKAGHARSAGAARVASRRHADELPGGRVEVKEGGTIAAVTHSDREQPIARCRPLIDERRPGAPVGAGELVQRRRAWPRGSVRHRARGGRERHLAERSSAIARSVNFPRVGHSA
jgi:hypothetical protein